MDFKAVVGVIASVISIISYIPYIKDIFVGKTKPHVFTWFLGGLISAIAYFEQVYAHAGAGAWVTGVSALLALFIFVLSIKKGHKNIVLIDWISLWGALLAIILWLIVKELLLSIILITFIDNISFVPTYRKSIHHPFEETISTYLLSGIKYFLGIVALESFNFISLLYPVSLVLTCWFFVVFLIIRRRQIRKS